MNKSDFFKKLEDAQKSGKVNTLLLHIETPANKNEVTIVQGEENVKRKIEYISSAYNEKMRLNRNDNVIITDYAFGDASHVGIREITAALFRDKDEELEL